MEAPQAYAGDPRGCVAVEEPGYGGYGCRTEGGFVAGVYIGGQAPGSSSPGNPGGSTPGSPGSYRPARPIDCSSVGSQPTPGNLWLYNYCNGANWRMGPSGRLYDCDRLAELYQFITDVDAAIACSDQQREGTQGREQPPAGPTEQPEQRCRDQARSALNPPRPQIEVNPRLGLTGLPSYFWLSNYQDDMRKSASFPASCSIGEWRAVSGRLDAQVVRYFWDFGDGWGMTTTTPGAAWPEWISEVYHTYERSSLQQPDQKYLVRVWAFWQGSFTLQAERERCITGQDGRQQCTT